MYDMIVAFLCIPNDLKLVLTVIRLTLSVYDIRFSYLCTTYPILELHQ